MKSVPQLGSGLARSEGKRVTCVCGACAERRESIVVRDVHDFPGHIACDTASNSEVVVPILKETLPAGHPNLVALIDSDSVHIGLFDDDDRVGLERIAHVLQEHLHFPMQHILAVQPDFDTAAAADEPAFKLASYAFGPGAPSPTDGGLTVAALPTAITAFRVTSAPCSPLPSLSFTPAAEKDSAEIAEWHFSSAEYDRIANTEENRLVEKALGCGALPEILYLNAVQISLPRKYAVPGHSPPTTNSLLLRFDTISIIQNAQSFYKSFYYQDKVAPTYRIPAATMWDTNYAHFDRLETGVDWAWRNNFFGLVSPAFTLTPVPPESEVGINWELLRDQTIPIQFFKSMSFFEDDLHDFGDVECSLKLRAMASGFLVLFRFALDVHGAGGVVRDVRIFHEVGKKHPTQSLPLVVVEEKLLTLGTGDSLAAKVDSAVLHSVHTYFLSLVSPHAGSTEKV